MEINTAYLRTALEASWSRETSSTSDEWSENRPSRGQCVPTALVAQDFLGGDLQKLSTVFNAKQESHYRNVLPDGRIFDATRLQYPDNQPLQVDKVELKGFGSIREKLLSEPDTLRRYQILKEAVVKRLDKQSLQF